MIDRGYDLAAHAQAGYFEELVFRLLGHSVEIDLAALAPWGTRLRRPQADASAARAARLPSSGPACVRPALRHHW
jgi:hypothetical protein